MGILYSRHLSGREVSEQLPTITGLRSSSPPNDVVMLFMLFMLFSVAIYPIPDSG